MSENETVFVVGHKNPDTDSVCAAIVYANLKRELTGKSFKPVIQGKINPETEFVLTRFNVPVPEIMEDAAGKSIILVDHSELKQAPENIKLARVVEVVDHHNIGDLTTGEPIYFLNEPVGCTCTLIAEKYFDSKVPLEIPMAGLMLASIVSDTILFKSPTCTQKDRDIALRLAKVVGVDIDSFGLELLRAKSDLGSKTVVELLNLDYKEYSMNGKNIAVSQIETVDTKELEAKKPELLSAVRKQKEQKGLFAVVLMITDVMKEESELLIECDNDGVIEKAFGARPQNNSLVVKGMLSRKKQVIPPLESALNEL
ncbi:MAG: manganese-dependent inorganic pyrophosphatase [Candidatus Diapherotrites archaeon]|nr:manganese-dependent inorganic pyrophosphatase [Candidatus Diapherotrites archaeon]